MFFDFHTHQSGIGESGIYNFRIGKDKDIPERVEYFTAGIHPWDVEDIQIQEALNELDILLTNDKCVGAGEIGLDKYFGTNLGFQIEVLRNQIEHIKKSSKKVLIIHCVKAFQEILTEKKRSDSDLIWVLHGFNGSGELIKRLIKAGFYFSLGEQILNKNSKISRFFNQIPIDRILLETDESNHSIKEIYQKAAMSLNLDLKDLQKQIRKNLKRLSPALNG